MRKRFHFRVLLFPALLGLLMLAACVLVARYGIRLARFSTPERRMRRQVRGSVCG